LFSGKVDELYVYNRVLNIDEIKKIYDGNYWCQKFEKVKQIEHNIANLNYITMKNLRFSKVYLDALSKDEELKRDM
jgi:hypothetical protein